jgi:F0F1-type ATP synthase beta subunit
MVTATSNGAVHKTGKIVQIIGSTFDAEFEEGHLPEIYNAVKVDTEFKGISLHLVGEVQQHLGGNRVRCVALGSARRRSAACSTCSASRSTAAAR